MKKLLNKKLIFPTLMLALVFVIVVLYCLGFRITYAPELQNSWNAVSAVAACVGVLASFIAIWFTIQVPKKIAEQQNKIALLEKRVQLYMEFTALFESSIWWGWSGKETFPVLKKPTIWTDDPLLVTASFLFSDELSDQLQNLYEKYKKIYWYNTHIQECISRLPDKVVEMFEYFTIENELSDISSEDFIKLQELTKKFEYVIEEPVDPVHTQKITINYLTLYADVSHLSNETFQQQKSILAKMKQEIDIFKSDK